MHMTTIKIKAMFIDKNAKGKRYIKEGNNVVFIKEQEAKELIKNEYYNYNYEVVSDYNWKQYYWGLSYWPCQLIKSDTYFKHEEVKPILIQEQEEKTQETNIFNDLDLIKEKIKNKNLTKEEFNKLFEFCWDLENILHEKIKEEIKGEQVLNPVFFNDNIKNDININEIETNKPIDNSEFDDDMPF